MTTTYTVQTKGPQGVQTVTVTRPNNNKADLTLIDVVTAPKPSPKPVVSESLTTTSVTSTNVSQTTSNEVTIIYNNPSLNLITA